MDGIPVSLQKMTSQLTVFKNSAVLFMRCIWKKFVNHENRTLLTAKDTNSHTLS